MKLFLIIGHTTRAKGAAYHKTNEYDEVSKILGNVSHPDIVRVPTGSIQDKVKWVNKHMQPEDICIEFHMDAPSDNSYSTLFYYGGSKLAMDLGASILAKYTVYMDKSGRLKADTATRFGRLGIIRDMKYKERCFLLELGFISNYVDLKKMQNFSHEAIYEVLCMLSPNTLKKTLQMKIRNMRVLLKDYPGIRPFYEKTIKKLKEML